MTGEDSGKVDPSPGLKIGKFPQTPLPEVHALHVGQKISLKKMLLSSLPEGDVFHLDRLEDSRSLTVGYIREHRMHSRYFLPLWKNFGVG